MARHNEILTGRHNRLLQKLFSMKGPPPAPQLTSEITPVLPLQHGVENRYLESWNKFFMLFNVNPSAGNQSGIRWRNPLTSNVICVIEKIHIPAPGAALTAQGVFGQTNVDLATIGTSQGLIFDTRPGGNTGANLVGSIQNTTAAVPSLVSQQVFAQGLFAAASGPLDFILYDNQEFPVLPGSAFQFISVAVNVGLLMFIWWRERFLEDSERS